MEPGGPEVLVAGKHSVPEPGPEEVLIKVVAAGVNRPDVLQRLGHYPAPAEASPLPGLEVSGHIAALGKGVSTLHEGDPVCALLPGGGYAEYAVAHAGSCLPIPNGITIIEAAALPETTFTVWHNVFERGKLNEGETLLVHGGASGIGTTAIQMAKAHNCEVVITAGTKEKCAACEALGADVSINYRKENFVEIMRNREPKGADVILDMVGGEYIPGNLRCLRPDGRLVFIAFLEGSKIEVDFMSLMLKRLSILGSTMRTRTNCVKARIAKAVLKTVWPWISEGLYKPHLDRILPLTEAANAHEIMENSGHIGKIVLKIDN